MLRRPFAVRLLSFGEGVARLTRKSATEALSESIVRGGAWNERQNAERTDETCATSCLTGRRLRAVTLCVHTQARSQAFELRRSAADCAPIPASFINTRREGAPADALIPATCCAMRIACSFDGPLIVR